ncbi:MAG: hypothetical protein LBR60_09415 [Fibrobacter sp.]|jgi:hypothetical protein|nr:hypothetical protein [Fibrobacter sp.]
MTTRPDPIPSSFLFLYIKLVFEGFRILKKTALLFFLLAAATSVASFSIYGNQSHVRWKSADTEHFIFHYPAEYTSHAELVAAHTEAVYDSVAMRYRKSLSGKTHISLHNALYSNGQAIPSENNMHLWLTNWDFKLRSSHSWVSDVVTHEFAHLISITNASKLPPFLYGFQFSFLDYYNERNTQDLLSFIPFTLLPLWFAEGTAQYESARMGFDSWDSHRDMLLRIASLNDQILDLEWMHAASDNSLLAELGTYTQGFSFVRYLSERYGDEVIPQIWASLSRPYRMTLDGALRQVVNSGEDELFEAWKKELKVRYEMQKESLGALVAGEKITTDAFYQDFPAVAGNSVYGVSNFGGPWFDGGIFKLPKSLDTLRDENAGDSLMILDYEGTININDYAESGFKAEKSWLSMGISVREFPERGPLLAYVTYQNRDRDGKAYFDIALADTNENKQVLTRFADAVYPEISPKRNEIIFARRESNSTRFVLSQIDIPESFKDSPGEIQDIFIPDPQFVYYNIYSPKFSPDGSQIVFGFFDDQTRGVALINRNGKNLKILTPGNIDARDPNWIDSSTIVYSGNQNGIFNLYALNLATGESSALTNVLGGAFTPAADSGVIFYTGYDADGFSLYRLDYVNPAETRDSVFSVSDTLITACAETIPPADTLIQDSLTADSIPQWICTPDTSITKRDSVIQIPKHAPLILAGNLPEKQTAELEKASISFSGTERHYKAIPSIPMVVPLFGVEERAPDFNVAADGKAIPKAGVAVSLKDALGINSIQIALLLEVGNGIDYITSDGLNPRMARDFFFGIENRSTPLTLGLAYSHRNIVGKDTIRYEDPRSHEDSLGTTRYAVPLHNVSGSAGYSLFKKGDSLAASVNYSTADFNLFEDKFQWTYHKQFSAGLELSILNDFPEDLSNISGQGNGLILSYRYALSDLYRPGTFSESFTVTPSGIVKPVYRTYQLHEIGGALFGSLENPIHSGARLAAGISLNGILKWSSRDTTALDDFFYHPLILEGYPYLITNEDFNRSGMKVAKAEVHYLFPIYEDFRKHFWIFATRDFFIDIYTQIGSAWNNHGIPFDKLKETRFWDRSVGIEFRMANTLFYNVPLDISLNLARGLDRIGENENGRGGRKMTPVKLPVIPAVASPTRIGFTIGMGFNARWMY